MLGSLIIKLTALTKMITLIAIYLDTRDLFSSAEESQRRRNNLLSKNLIPIQRLPPKPHYGP